MGEFGGNSNSLIGTLLKILGININPAKWAPGWNKDIAGYFGEYYRGNGHGYGPDASAADTIAAAQPYIGMGGHW